MFYVYALFDPKIQSVNKAVRLSSAIKSLIHCTIHLSLRVRRVITSVFFGVFVVFCQFLFPVGIGNCFGGSLIAYGLEHSNSRQFCFYQYVVYSV